MSVSAFIEKIGKAIPREEAIRGEIIYNNQGCTLLPFSASSVEFCVDSDTAEADNHLECTLLIEETPSGKYHIVPECNEDRSGWDRYAYACLLKYEEYMNLLLPREKTEHKRYSREGMRKRVLDERRLSPKKTHK